MSEPTTFEIVIRGTGGHAALPHLTTDPIVTAATLITAIQTLVSRVCDPMQTGVVSICSIHGGEASNVIPDTVKLVGTVRAHDDAVFDLIHTHLKDMADGIARGFGCRGEIEYTPSYPSVQNDAAATDYALGVAEEVCGRERVMRIDKAVMASEDFSFYGIACRFAFAFRVIRANQKL